MNRRKALIASMLMGGLAPLSMASGQDTIPRRKDDRFRRSTVEDDRLDLRIDPDADDTARRQEPGDEPPADFPGQPGHQWRTYDISNYTRIAQGQDTNPQGAIVEWIFRRTGSSLWHGDKIAVLSAGRSQLRAYHDERTLEQVEEVLERFTNAAADLLAIRVQIVVAADPRWRYAVYQRLTAMEGGPNGQQIWSAKVEDAALILTQMSAYQGFRLVSDQEYKVVNGQTLTIKATTEREFVQNLQKSSAAGQGFQPGSGKISEGGVLRLSPLLHYEGDHAELAVELRAGAIKKLHATKVIAPREVGATEMSIDVPEVAETRLNQTISDWPLDRTLIISAGIVPGVLQPTKGGGIFNSGVKIPGWTPGTTELLIFLNAKPSSVPSRTARDDRGQDNLPARDRDRDDGTAADRSRERVSRTTRTTRGFEPEPES